MDEEPDDGSQHTDTTGEVCACDASASLSDKYCSDCESYVSESFGRTRCECVFSYHQDASAGTRLQYAKLEEVESVKFCQFWLVIFEKVTKPEFRKKESRP